jgi:hypothetical protein
MVSSYYRLVWEAAGGQAWVIERYVEEPSLVALDLEAEKNEHSHSRHCRGLWRDINLKG